MIATKAALLIVSALLCGLAGLSVPAGRVNLLAFGVAALAASFLV